MESEIDYNPWNIQSIYELQYFNCPVVPCVFKNQSKQDFVNHAAESHPNSIPYLSNIKDESLNDVILPMLNVEIKVEEPDEEVSENNTPGCISCGKELLALKVLGMVSNKMSIRTIFGHEKISAAFDVYSYFKFN